MKIHFLIIISVAFLLLSTGVNLSRAVNAQDDKAGALPEGFNWTEEDVKVLTLEQLQSNVDGLLKEDHFKLLSSEQKKELFESPETELVELKEQFRGYVIENKYVKSLEIEELVGNAAVKIDETSFTATNILGIKTTIDISQYPESYIEVDKQGNILIDGRLLKIEADTTVEYAPEANEFTINEQKIEISSAEHESITLQKDGAFILPVGAVIKPTKPCKIDGMGYSIDMSALTNAFDEPINGLSGKTSLSANKMESNSPWLTKTNNKELKLTQSTLSDIEFDQDKIISISYENKIMYGKEITNPTKPYSPIALYYGTDEFSTEISVPDPNAKNVKVKLGGPESLDGASAYISEDGKTMLSDVTKKIRIDASAAKPIIFNLNGEDIEVKKTIEPPKAVGETKAIQKETAAIAGSIESFIKKRKYDDAIEEARELEPYSQIAADVKILQDLRLKDPELKNPKNRKIAEAITKEIEGTLIKSPEIAGAGIVAPTTFVAALHTLGWFGAVTGTVGGLVAAPVLDAALPDYVEEKPVGDIELSRDFEIEPGRHYNFLTHNNNLIVYHENTGWKKKEWLPWISTKSFSKAVVVKCKEDENYYLLTDKDKEWGVKPRGVILVMDKKGNIVNLKPERGQIANFIVQTGRKLIKSLGET